MFRWGKKHCKAILSDRIFEYYGANNFSFLHKLLYKIILEHIVSNLFFFFHKKKLSSNQISEVRVRNRREGGKPRTTVSLLAQGWGYFQEGIWNLGVAEQALGVLVFLPAPFPGFALKRTAHRALLPTRH